VAVIREIAERKAVRPAPAALPPLRLLVPDDEGYCAGYTETEIEAYELMERICPDPARGRAPYTEDADALIRILETDPVGFIDYARRFVAAKVAKYPPKPTKKRSVT
jgi:hypothetical protein